MIPRSASTIGRLLQGDCLRLPAASRLGIFLFAVHCLSMSVLSAQEPARKPPNILFIMSDDHASAAVSCYGPSFLGKFAYTPNIDRIAKGGVLFRNALVTNSICTPSRAAILTGQYAHKNGVTTLSTALSPQTVHLGHWLRRAGYATALIGKWHLQIDPTGFEYWNVLPGQGVYYNPVLKQVGKGQKEYTGYSTDVVTDLSLDWLKNRDASKPFFLCCHYKAPHRPWDPAPRFKDLYKDEKIPEPPTLLDDYANRAEASKRAKMRVGENMNLRDLGGVAPPAGLLGNDLRRWAYQIYMKRYLACVAAVDENVGRLLDYLDKNGLANDTIVIYTSDQGFFLGEHGWFDKRFMLEPCLTTPLVVRYPAQVPAGRVVEQMVVNIDHAPTFLDYAGEKVPGDLDGRSFRPLLEGKAPADWRTSAYYRYWMHLDGSHNVTAHYGVRTDRYTLIHYYGKGLGVKGASKVDTEPQWELFDRQSDPAQMRNLIDDPGHREIVERLKTELTRLRKEAGDDQ